MRTLLVALALVACDSSRQSVPSDDLSFSDDLAGRDLSFRDLASSDLAKPDLASLDLATGDLAQSAMAHGQCWNDSHCPSGTCPASRP